jgi:hypothetical protein
MSAASATQAMPSNETTTLSSSGRQTVVLSQRDAEELAARRAAEARLEAQLHGWKAIVIWYVLWSVIMGIGAISALSAGQAGAGLTCIAISAASAFYAHYLYNGGRRRIWFVIW